jgi:hypothetical protein
MFGMTEDGKIGHFPSDLVTNYMYLDPVGDLKEKALNKKAKMSDFSISGPVDVDHAMHWGSDRKKWASKSSSENELRYVNFQCSSTLVRTFQRYK